MRSREPRLFKQPLQGDLRQIRDKQVQSPELGSESPERKIQRFTSATAATSGRGPGSRLFVFSPGQPGKPFFFENQRDGHGAHPVPALFQDAADIIDGEILLSQSDDLVPDTIGFGRSLGSLLRGKEEGALWMLAELMGEDAEASRGIPEAAGNFGGGELIDEVGPEGFVLAVGGILGFEKEAGHRC